MEYLKKYTAILLGSTGIFAHNHLGLQRMVRKRENIQWAAVVWTKKPCWGQRRMGRLVRDDRKASIVQITTRYNQGMQNTISERTTRQTLKQMGYSSRRPHRVPFLSAKNRTRRLHFTQAHQNWTIEDWKNVAWSDESRFLLRHSVGRVRIWRKEHESMDPSCLVSNLQQQRDAIMSIWTKISKECFQHLVESMPQIIKAVLKAKVGPTRY